MVRFFEHSTSPLYTQVADALRERIVKGAWPIGLQVPTLRALAQEFGVALITVRQAVRVLRDEGLLIPEQGRGTFVRSKPETHPKMRVETSLPALAEQTSALQLFDRPLHMVADQLGRTGGLRRITYREAADLVPVVGDLIGGAA